MSKDIRAAYVFPGQGSQEKGMGSDLYHSYACVRKLYDDADSMLKFPISEMSFFDSTEELNQTVNVQPAILLASLACFEAAREIAANGLPEPVFMAGHSVGEYSALVISGALQMQDALKLTRERGKLMQLAAEQNPGGMLALIGAQESTVNEVCTESGTEISNINAPGQIVISGIAKDIEKAKQIAQSKGIKRIVPLKVSGPFHSRWMQPAADGIAALIHNVNLKTPSSPIISNVTARPLSTADEIRSELISQIIKTVQWKKSVEYIISSGINVFVEFGHGQVITGLIRRINPSVQIFSIGDVDTASQVQRMIQYINS